MADADSKEDAKCPGETDDIAARSQKPLSDLLTTYSYLLSVCLPTWNSATQPDGFP
jgi:hypothetical protein